VVRADMLDKRGRPLNQSLIPRPNRRAPDADHLSDPHDDESHDIHGCNSRDDKATPRVSDGSVEVTAGS